MNELIPLIAGFFFIFLFFRRVKGAISIQQETAALFLLSQLFVSAFGFQS
jgi:hypothetical protein